NCLLRGNSAHDGGGAIESTLSHCTVTGNWAWDGGGAVGGILNNCIVVGNSATNEGGSANWIDGRVVLNFCCTTPLPTIGFGNIIGAPLFVDAANGNFRLQSNSPCINAGRNAYAAVGPDLDGNSRIIGGTVDIGAYEFQSPQSTISYAWLQQYGLP